MSNVLISLSEKQGWRDELIVPGYGTRRVPATVLHAMISVDGCTPHTYRVDEHENCPGEGYKFVTQDAWSNTGRCTGCDLNEYNGIGD